jgi:hypothetical protein
MIQFRHFKLTSAPPQLPLGAYCPTPRPSRRGVLVPSRGLAPCGGSVRLGLWRGDEMTEAGWGQTMAKIFRRSRKSAAKLLVSADKLDSRAKDPKDRDDSDWLRRRAERVRLYAIKKEKARLKKSEERRKNA